MREKEFLGSFPINYARYQDILHKEDIRPLLEYTIIIYWVSLSSSSMISQIVMPW